MPKSRHLLVALTNPIEGKEDEFNEWYETYHVPECVRVKGFKSGQRFKLSASQHDAPRQAYLALYELEGDDPQAILNELEATRGDRTQSDTMDRASLSLWVFTEIGEKHVSED